VKFLTAVNSGIPQSLLRLAALWTNGIMFPLGQGFCPSQYAVPLWCPSTCSHRVPGVTLPERESIAHIRIGSRLRTLGTIPPLSYTSSLGNHVPCPQFLRSIYHPHPLRQRGVQLLRSPQPNQIIGISEWRVTDKLYVTLIGWCWPLKQHWILHKETATGWSQSVFHFIAAIRPVISWV
jgi:hypothetical protein